MKMRSQELSDELAAFEKQGIQVANLSVPSGYVAIVLKALLYTKDLERDNLVLQADVLDREDTIRWLSTTVQMATNQALQYRTPGKKSMGIATRMDLAAMTLKPQIIEPDKVSPFTREQKRIMETDNGT